MAKWRLNLQLTRAFFLSLLFVVGFGVVAYLTLGERLTAFDQHWIAVIQGMESPTKTQWMKFFTLAGSTGVVIGMSVLILLFLWFRLRHRAEAVLFLLVLAGAGVLNQVLKMIFHRPRPEFHRLAEATGYSFPSGHSMSAFAFYGVLAFLLWRHVPTKIGRGLVILAGVAMTLLIGVSRVYLGVHYPSDVVGGYLGGGFWLAASIWVYQSIAEKEAIGYA